MENSMSIPARETKTASGRAAAAILGLISLALVLSPHPPTDRLIPALATLAGEHRFLASALLQSSFAFAIGAGAAVFAAFAILRILDILGLKRAGALLRRRRHSWLATFTAYVLCLAILALARRCAWIGGTSQRSGENGIPERGSATAGVPPLESDGLSAEESRQPLPAVPFLPFAAAGALLVGGISFVLLRSRDGRGSAVAAPTALEDTAGASEAQKALAIAASRRKLESGGSAREAIIACYAEMCALFAPDGGAIAGAARSARNLTAREFAALLRSEGSGEPEIAALTSVFEKARYSNEDCAEADRLRAIESLQALELLYGGGGS
jgi:hypothetical protein